MKLRMMLGLCVLLLGCSAQLSKSTGAPEGMALKGGRAQICRGEPIPSGWVIDNGTRDARCPSSPLDRRPSMYWIVDISDGPVGNEINVCVYSDIPADWVVIERMRVPNRCFGAYPPSGGRPTMKKIRKV